MALLPSAVEQALRTLEHMDRTTLVACGAGKRIRQLANTTQNKKKAAAFDSSYQSPKRLSELHKTARARRPKLSPRKARALASGRGARAPRSPPPAGGASRCARVRSLTSPRA